VQSPLFSRHHLRISHSKLVEVFYLDGEIIENNVVVSILCSSCVAKFFISCLKEILGASKTQFVDEIIIVFKEFIDEYSILFFYVEPHIMENNVVVPFCVAHVLLNSLSQVTKNIGSFKNPIC
jgi:hypothetical protein